MTTPPEGDPIASAVSDRDVNSVYAEDGPDGLRIIVLGEVDLNSHPELEEVGARAAAAPPGDITVDLSQATFIDSTMLGFLATLHAKVQETGHELTLLSPQRAVRRALSVVGFDRMMKIVDS